MPRRVAATFAPPTVTLSPAEVPLITGRTAARLEQARLLAEDRNWAEAIGLFRELMDTENGRVVGIDERRYVSLRTYCHMQIAGLPAEGLAAYRRAVDPLAEVLYREGLATRDEPTLRRVVDEHFCSSWGDDALFALGELALERADFAAARRDWEQIAFPLRVDAAEAEWLTYPDTDLDIAAVHARLVLASIRAGEQERAAAELEVFRRRHPTATGRFGGQEGRLVDMLARLMEVARGWQEIASLSEWSTFAGSPARNLNGPPLGEVAGPAWRAPIRFTPGTIPQRTRIVIVDGQPRVESAPASQRTLSTFPIAADGRLYFSDGAEIRAANLADGRPAITQDGVIYRADRAAEVPAARVASTLDGAPRHTLALRDGILYSRVGSPVTGRLQPDGARPADWLVGLDLTRDGSLAFRARPEEDTWCLDGTPVTDGRRVFVALRRSDVNPQAAVACFDAASGRQLWQTAVGGGNTLASGSGDEITHNLLSLVEDRLYLNTNLGLVASVRSSDGAISWLHRYDRHADPVDVGSKELPIHFQRGPSPAVYHEGLLLVAPSDTAAVLALDSATGAQIWKSEELAEAAHLLGVVDDLLIASGRRLWGLNVRTGRPRDAGVSFQTPPGDVQHVGRGVIAGREVFWPVGGKIYVADAGTGAQTRAPIDIAAIGEDGANLIAGEGYIVAAGYDRIMAYEGREARGRRSEIGGRRRNGN
jgi:outer membrane protein assembly factor BamB